MARSAGISCVGQPAAVDVAEQVVLRADVGVEVGQVDSASRHGYTLGTGADAPGRFGRGPTWQPPLDVRNNARMRIHVAADHAGFELKASSRRSPAGTQVTRSSTTAPTTYDSQDDYPPMCLAAGEAVVADPGSLGVVIGGSGNGEQIAANKVDGVRAALAWNLDTARLGRQHNDANVIAVGARQHTVAEALCVRRRVRGRAVQRRPASSAAHRPARAVRGLPR